MLVSEGETVGGGVHACMCEVRIYEVCVPASGRSPKMNATGKTCQTAGWCGSSCRQEARGLEPPPSGQPFAQGSRVHLHWLVDDWGEGGCVCLRG